MGMSNLVERVVASVEAYSRGELDPLFEMLSPKVVWIAHGPKELPWAGTYEGPDGVRRYLERLQAEVEIRSYTLRHTPVHQDDWVFYLATAKVSYRSTGFERDTPTVDVMQFEDQHVVRFEEFFDTATTMSDLGKSP